MPAKLPIHPKSPRLSSRQREVAGQVAGNSPLRGARGWRAAAGGAMAFQIRHVAEAEDTDHGRDA